MERTELHSQLEQKLSENWNAYVDRLLCLPPIQIIGKAAEISATRFCYSELTENTPAYPDHLLECLIGFNDPLSVLREQWMDERSIDRSEAMERTLWSLWDNRVDEGSSIGGVN